MEPAPGARRDPPVVEDLRAAQSAEQMSFHMPGHKGGRGAPALGLELLGAQAYAADLSELSGFDYLHSPRGGVAEAQRAAAGLFGAERTWFLVNGATVGNLAAMGAAAGDDDPVLVARSSHRSVYAGLTLSGARPVYLPPRRNVGLDGLFGIDLLDVAAALAAEPGARAIHVTSPNYYGFTVPIRELARMAHDHGIPLIVDEAHGAHFALSSRFPSSALACGADLVIQSPHKTLGSLTQSSLLHQQGGLVDDFRIDALLQMLQSSSPSALLLVSLDVTLAETAVTGTARWEAAAALGDSARKRMAAIDGIVVYGAEVQGSPGISEIDPTKLVVDVSGLGTTAFAAADWMRERHRINPEFADLRRLVFSVTVGDTEQTVDLLVTAVSDLAARAGALSGSGGSLASLWPLDPPEMVVRPRPAAALGSYPMDLSKSAGRVAGEMIVPYPPGIPLIVPGERITEGFIGTLHQLRSAGCRMVGTSDPSLSSLRCIDP